jgi:cytochrome d ubiquinol oxidase subunit I
VTEVGRQPWIIYGVMRTRDALTPVPGQIFHFAGFALLYLLIGASTLWMWRRQVVAAKTQQGPSAERKSWARGTHK